jgi:hypothetical protein
MPVAHGGSQESGSRPAHFIWTRPGPADLARCAPAEGSVLAAAVARAGIERRDPRPRVAGFDNKCTDRSLP